MDCAYSPASRLAEFAIAPEAARRFDIRHLTNLFVNYIGCALAGSKTPTSDAAVRGCRTYSSEGSARLIGREDRVSSSDAVLLDCLSSAVLAFDDTHLATILHPTGPVASALLGIARTRPLSGRTFLNALGVGIEIQCRVALAFASPATGAKIGWYATGLAGGIGAAAAVGRVLSFDVKQLSNALGLAAATGCGNRATHGSMATPFVPAFAAECGYRAALLTQAGFTCNPGALDGRNGLVALVADRPDWVRALQDLPSGLETARTMVKPYPCGVVIHPAVDGCLSLVREHRVTQKNLASLKLGVSSAAAALSNNRSPRDFYESCVSLYYWAASILIIGRADLSQIEESLMASGDVAELQVRISVEERPQMGADQCHLSATVMDGRHIELLIDHARGSVDRPLTDEEVDEKFLSLATRSVSHSKATQLLAMCRNVSELTSVAAVITD